MPEKLLFIDRDGTLILDPPPSYQLDKFPKLTFYPHVIEYLNKIANHLDYRLIMVTNQDGLGTDSFPEDTFWPPHNFIIKTLENENIHFDKIFIDRSLPSENKNTRKPGTAMLTEYMGNEEYDMESSFVIGDRISDVLLAKNLGCRAFFLNNHTRPEVYGNIKSADEVRDWIALETTAWKDIYEYLLNGQRRVTLQRHTKETDIKITLNPDGSGKANIHTGLHFFDHMLEQIARHGQLDLDILCKGDLEVDEHHTIEDTGIALGEAFSKSLGDKRGMNRYGFTLPMDDALAQVAVDFGGRNWIVWDVNFKREKIGDVPTEMFFHFFKSFSDAAKCNLNIKVEGENEHHKIESVFKAFAKALKMAVARDPESKLLPSTKGVL